MKIEQKKFSALNGWEAIRCDDFNTATSNLVLVFGSKDLLKDASLYKEMRQNYPSADIIMNTTSGEIMDIQVNDETISLTAIKFDKTQLKTAFENIAFHKNSFDAGCALANQIDPVNLKNVLIIADGQLVNGSELISGLQSVLSEDVIITGGLAGDGSRFQSTLVGLNNSPTEGTIIIIGFYGSLVVTYGSVGGWDTFGPERMITKSKANVLYELDGKPALDIYKKYLGEQANELPGSALLFPLSIRVKECDDYLVRTILNVSEIDQSLTFAGNMPEGNYARLMKANFDRLIEGSSSAAQNSLQTNKPELAILISCVGRKLVLDQRIEEEIEVVRAVYGAKTAITGFYSYGEFSPSNKFSKCELHNQTMTITTFSEE